MAVLALIVLAVWLVAVAGVRTYLQYRRTGVVATPTRARPGSAAWWAKASSSLGIILAVAAPVAELAGFPAIGPLDTPAIRGGGLVLAVVGIAATLGAQLSMGDAWRPDVDPEARGPLVTTGPFQLVRNPVLTCTAATVIGLAMMVPNILAALMLLAVLAGLQVQVRYVEEPYLTRVHGDAYRRYAAATGRFLPGIGRLRSD